MPDWRARHRASTRASALGVWLVFGLAVALGTGCSHGEGCGRGADPAVGRPGGAVSTRPSAPEPHASAPGPGGAGSPGGAPPARRIVSLTPSTTEILFALDVGDRVVGVSRFCDFPPAARTRPRVGGFTDPSLEAILALTPDLVVGARGPTNRGVVEALAARGVATAFPPDGDLDDVRASIRTLGALAGAGRRADALVAAIDADLLAIRAALAGRRPVRTLVVLGSRPLAVAGPGGFLDDMLRAAGGENVVAEGPPWPTIGVERVLELAPEVIVEAGLGMGSEPGLDWSRWPSIPAVRDGRVVRIDDVRLLRPGPRVAEGAAVLARALHPDAALPRVAP